MPRPKVWGDFTKSTTFEGKDSSGNDLVEFTCPYECGNPIRMKASNVIKNKCTDCRLHLMKCEGVSADGRRAEDDIRIRMFRAETVKTNERLQDAKGNDAAIYEAYVDAQAKPYSSSSKRPRPEPSFTSVIYRLIFIPENRPVYTGKTRREHKRLAEHASRSSKCRLVRNAFRKHGRKAFRLEVQLRCDDADADANESLLIVQNNTMYPNGYNLRHGSAAGEECEGGSSSALVASCTGVVPFEGVADELEAESEACAELADVLRDLDETQDEDVDGLLREMIRQVHPDRQTTEKTYTANEVTAMLNSVREAL